MPAPVYSTRFAAGVIASGISTVVYTVPALKTAIVSDVMAIVSFGSTAYGFWALPGTANIGRIVLPNTDTEYHWRGHQVFNAGDQLRIQSTSGDFYYAVSGYLLSN